MKLPVDISRGVPRLGLNRAEVALALGVSPNTVDAMVEDGSLPPPRQWHSRKFWIVSEVQAFMSEWPVGGEQQETGDPSKWRASA